MKKLLALLTIGAALSMQAATLPPNPGPTYVNLPVFTNITMGATAPIFLSTNAWAAAQATAVKWNQQYGLTDPTNRYFFRDVIACWAWHWAERNAVPEWRAEQDAKADVQSIRTKLTDATDTQLNQIKAILGL